MKYLRKAAGIVLLLNIIPLLMWATWDKDYRPHGWFDGYMNSLHPYIAGWLVLLIVAVIAGTIFLGFFLLIKE